MHSAESFIEFVKKSPTAFHAVAELSRMLEKNGYAPLEECANWSVLPGGKYYITRNRSALIAVNIPESGFAPYQIVASHSDSPTFKLKPACEDDVCGHYVRLNTEKYGGMLMSTWFDRPLSIAGRILVRTENGIETRLVNVDRDTVLIPNMPIHFNREINDGYKYNAQVDMLPLFGDETAHGELMKTVAESAGVSEEKIVGSDLFLYNRVPGCVWGANREFFSSGRIDDLECAYTSTEAFLSADPHQHINVLAVFDNEEVGSGTKQGADSSFLADVTARIAAAMGRTDSEYRAAIAGSFMVSADNAHAVHPNHPEKYDSGNRTYMNGGVVVKFNANQKYTTDGVSCAIFETICAQAGVPVQHFANRSDVAGGSTLGNIANTHTSMNTVDIGLAQLAMHSAYETAGCRDVEYMIQALKAFYETDVRVLCDGNFLI